MTRKVSILLPFLIFAAASNAAYSVENYATEEYVDDLFIELVDLVDTEASTPVRSLKANDTKLYQNQLILRDMLNGKDADDNWIKLDTEAQLAIPAINELKAALDAVIEENQATGDYALASDLNALQSVVEGLQSGSVDSTEFQTLKTTVETISADYAKKSELTDVETRLQNAINAIVIPNLDEYAKSADVAATYATKTDLNGLATTEELEAKASATDLQNLQTNITDNYLTKTDAQNTYLTQEVANNTYVTEQQVVQQITNVVGSADAGLLKDVADNKAAIAAKADTTYVDAELAKKADKTVLESAVSDLESKIDQAVIDASNIDLSSYAKSADVAATYATKDSVETITTALESAGYQTAQQVQGAITTATADFVTDSELGAYAKTETVNAELSKKVNADDLKALAYKDAVATADIDDKAVTVAKIQGARPTAENETMLLSVDKDGNATWLSVEIY